MRVGSRSKWIGSTWISNNQFPPIGKLRELVTHNKLISSKMRERLTWQTS